MNIDQLRAPSTRPAWNTRIIATMVIIAFAAFVGYFIGVDALWPLHGARRLLSGMNPYAAPYPELHSGAKFTWLYYPLPAVLLFIPFTWLPDRIAMSVVMALSSGLLSWAAWPVPARRWLFVSYPFMFCLILGQPWPLIAAAALCIPSLAPLALCKPTIGLVALLSRPEWPRWPVAVVAVLCGASVPLGWLAHSSSHDSKILVATLAGAPVALALLAVKKSWRARVVALLGCVPTRYYDVLPIGVLPTTHVQAVALAAIGWLAPLATGREAAPWAVALFILLPAVAVTLWQAASERSRVQNLEAPAGQLPAYTPTPD